jgi:hypothetical protein
LENPSVEKIRTKLEHPESIFIQFRRDAWQGNSRPEIVEKYFGGSEIPISDMFILSAILNSNIATFLHFNNSPKATRGDFPKILIADLKDFPVVKLESKAELVIKTYVKYIDFLMIYKPLDIIFSFYDQLVNALIYELYFPKELKSANKNLLFYLDAPKPITDDMSDEEKLAIIQSKFERLYEPNHPVRHNLETLDSVEEVRIIREALK